MLSIVDELRQFVHEVDGSSVQLFRLRRDSSWSFVEGFEFGGLDQFIRSVRPDGIEYLSSLEMELNLGSGTIVAQGQQGGYFDGALIVFLRFSGRAIAAVSVRGASVSKVEFRRQAKKLADIYERELVLYNRRTHFQSAQRLRGFNVDRAGIARSISGALSVFSVNSVVSLPRNMDLGKVDTYIDRGWAGSKSEEKLLRDRNLRRIVGSTANESLRLINSSGDVILVDSEFLPVQSVYSSTGPTYCYRTTVTPSETRILLAAWSSGLTIFPAEFDGLFHGMEVSALCAAVHADHSRQLNVHTSRVERNLTFRSSKVYQFMRHEVKNIASSSGAALEMMQEDLNDYARKLRKPLPKSIKQRISKLFENFERIRSSMNSLSNLSEDELDTQRNKISLLPSIKSVAEGFSDRFTRSGVSFDVVGDRSNIEGYDFLFEQIFVNLFENSLNAFQKDIRDGAKWILIEIDESQSHVDIIYKDSAGGIRLPIDENDDLTVIASEDEASKVFEIGYTTTAGTGFGMALVEACAHVHGGNAKVTSNSDVGVEVSIRLGFVAIPPKDALLKMRTVGR